MIDDKRVVMAYSFDGFQIAPGTHKLLSTSNKPLDVTAGDIQQAMESIFVLYNQVLSHISITASNGQARGVTVSPNPSNGLISFTTTYQSRWTT